MTFTNHTMATSEGFKRKSRYYEAGVCAQLIMAAPMVPQFTSELWEGLRGMDYKLSAQDWSGEVLDQRWPQQHAYHLPTRTKWNIKVNNRALAPLRLPADVTDADEVLRQVMRNEQVLRVIGAYDVVDTVARGRSIQLLTNRPKGKKKKQQQQQKQQS